MNRVIRQSLQAIAVGAVVSSIAAPAEAQQEGFGRPTAGIFGGVSLPTSDFKQTVGNGWHAGALIKARAYGPLDVRIDGTYSRLGDKEIDEGIAVITTKPKITFGTINALVNLSPDSAAYPGDNTLSPHIIAGIGGYNLDFNATCAGECTTFNNPEAKTYWGLNVGGGATVPIAGIRTFVEGRYHRISRPLEEGGARWMFLISAGVKLR